MSQKSDAMALAMALWTFADQKTKKLLRSRYVSVVGVAPVEDTPIEELGLSMRAHSMLRRAGIDTVEQLRRMSKREIMAVKGIGEMYADEILDAL